MSAARSADATIPASTPPVPSHSIVAAQRRGSRPAISAAQATWTADSRARSVSPMQLSAAATTRSVLTMWRNESASSATARAASACQPPTDGALPLLRTAGQQGVREVKTSTSQCIRGETDQRIATGLHRVPGRRRSHESDERDCDAVEAPGPVVSAHLTQPRRSGRRVQ
jgi:hypothetical protein